MGFLQPATAKHERGGGDESEREMGGVARKHVYPYLGTRPVCATSPSRALE